MMDGTRRLWEVVEQHESSVLPANLLDGLRAALDAGLSCEQITAFLVLAAGLYESVEQFDGPELVYRAQRVAEVIKGHRQAVRGAAGRWRDAEE